jgi:glycyl-tRNA synthetase beta chain
MLVEAALPLDLDTLLALAVPAFGALVADPRAAVAAFVFDRLAGALREQGYSAREVDAVLALAPQRLAEVPRRLEAVRAFAALPEAEALAAANKRIANILKKSTEPVEAKADPALFSEAAEGALWTDVATVRRSADVLFAAGDYTSSLKALAALRAPVDRFFDDVMVNADDPGVRANRLGLLATLHGVMNRVADLSRLTS